MVIGCTTAGLAGGYYSLSPTGDADTEIAVGNFDNLFGGTKQMVAGTAVPNPTLE
jgi:hypothetical protein